jgi:hypothetical protein
VLPPSERRRYRVIIRDGKKFINGSTGYMVTVAWTWSEHKKKLTDNQTNVREGLELNEISDSHNGEYENDSLI